MKNNLKQTQTPSLLVTNDPFQFQHKNRNKSSITPLSLRK